MTAPTRTRTQQPPSRTRRRARATPATEETPDTPRRRQRAPRRTSQRGRTSAAERAYARRAQRADLVQREGDAPAPARRRVLLRRPRSRTSFVLLMMGLLAAGVAASLWLSTQAIADTYRLERLREDTAGLAERVDQLQREVTGLESPAALDERARRLGMVPGGDPARIVVAPDGTTTLVGEPKAAVAPPPPPPPSRPTAEPPADTERQPAPEQGAPADEGTDQQTDQQADQQGDVAPEQRAAGAGGD
ncbi:Septum formation initiator [Amycolatopsis arida]|uniref:Septum formation initiator n=1 Tax=Amycolatopsis arida TaxID=587909 RepID=A0A1I5VHT6_9PSEU|nr:hypothetical protein [Amycolatopsis arida]TDX87893.1 hypothetical protein CLV69_11226 [Amycolatopsis arida]SFQ07104.1 Septum formation initiator [Amycolatopsis arida]